MSKNFFLTAPKLSHGILTVQLRDAQRCVAILSMGGSGVGGSVSPPYGMETNPAQMASFAYAFERARKMLARWGSPVAAFHAFAFDGISVSESARIPVATSEQMRVRKRK